MAYVNVADWSPDQVAEWLKGLDDVLQPYIHLFVTKNINGNRLLHLAPDDFRLLSISCIGHQEIILQGIELLRNIHYQIDQENVQYLSLRLSSKARSIFNELRETTLNGHYGISGEEEDEKNETDSRNDGNRDNKKERVATSVLSGVSDVLSSVKTLVSWLHRNPFHGIEQYDELKSHLLDLSIRLATIAQRDSFAENPVSVIRECCRKLAEIADSIIQDSSDPLILQPAFLDVVTIKKRADDTWGMGLYSSYQGVHQISVLRALSPAHTCGKLMSGDQVVQVNYQTVVGWTSHKLTQLMQENPVQIILTVKKCPMHVNMVTEIYFKPFRLPSKKRTYSPWINNSISNQRYDLQSIPNLQFIKSFDGRSAAQRAINTEPHPKSVTPPTTSLNSSGSDIGPVTASESDSEEVVSDLDDDAFMSGVEFGSSGAPSLSGRLFQPKPRPHVQRRATIPGATARHTLPFDHLLQGYCHRPLIPGSMGESFSQDTYQYVFRNNNESPENRGTRPHTCIGTENKKKLKERKGEEEGEMPFIDESDEKEDCVSVREMSPPKKLASSTTAISSNIKRSSFGPTDSLSLKNGSSLSSKSLQEPSSPPKSPIETIDELRAFRKISEDRPKLDKSYSSPTYDLDDGDATAFLERKPALKPVKEKSPLIRTTDQKTENLKTQTFNKSNGSDQSLVEVQNTSLSESETASINNIEDNKTDIYNPVEDSESCHSSSVSSLVRSNASVGSQYSVGFKGNRRISCRDLGLGDHHGWLYRKKDSKSFLLPHRWEKRWFILKKSYLYGYRDKDAPKADSLIYLPGFHVCPAPDVKSKRFAFKIYHTSGATFYFACDSAEERSRWMSQMGVSAISSFSHMELQQERETGSTGEEAYYSETDDELEKSPSNQRSSLSPNKMSPGREGMSLVQYSCGTSTPIGSSSRTTSSPNTRGGTTTTSSSSKVSPLGSLSTIGTGKQGLRFLQSPKGVMSNPLPTQNFRSYIRVRETANNSRVSVESSVKGNSPGEGSPAEMKERKGVGRKGSLRERLKQLPASLTLDRRKQKHSPPDRVDTGGLKGVSGSRSETSLLDPSGGTSKGIKKDSAPCMRPIAQVPGYMRPTHSSSMHTDIDSGPTNGSKNGRRGSIGGLSISSSSLRSVSPRRGSLDCLVAKSASPPVSPQRSTAGSTGSISAQDEYREGSPEKLWISSLRSNVRSPGPVITREREVERLKRTVQYQPIQRNKGDTMQFAFELSLSGSPKKTHPVISPKLREESSFSQSRPQVPPRTKFLSPSERFVSSPSLATSGSQTSASALRSKAPPNLTLSPPQEEADSPKTPLKPTMGVSMIGKQRRTPGALSPREILPEYPGMEYPPTFEPESYTLNPPPSDGIYASPPQHPPKDNVGKGISPLGPKPTQHGQHPRKSSQGGSPVYVNISHVSNTIAETNVKSYHHNIYVTSPCKESVRETYKKNGSPKPIPPPVPPNKPSRKVYSPPQRVLAQADNNTLKNSQRAVSSVSPGSPANPFSTSAVSPQRDTGNEYVTMGTNATSPSVTSANSGPTLRMSSSWNQDRQ